MVLGLYSLVVERKNPVKMSSKHNSTSVPYQLRRFVAVCLLPRFRLFRGAMASREYQWTVLRLVVVLLLGAAAPPMLVQLGEWNGMEWTNATTRSSIPYCSWSCCHVVRRDIR